MVEILLLVVIGLLVLMWRELVLIRRRDKRVAINIELIRRLAAGLGAGQSLQMVGRFPMYVTVEPGGGYVVWCAGAVQRGDLDTTTQMMAYYNPDPMRWCVLNEIPPQLEVEMEGYGTRAS